MVECYTLISFNQKRLATLSKSIGFNYSISRNSYSMGENHRPVNITTIYWTGSSEPVENSSFIGYIIIKNSVLYIKY